VAWVKTKKDKFPSYDEFLNSTKEKKFAPVYLFVGEEEYFIDEAVELIINNSLTSETKPFNLDIIYGSKSDARDVISHAASFPMMSERRVVIVKEFDKLLVNDTSKEIVQTYLSRPLASTCLVLIVENPDFRTKPFNDLRKSGIVFAFHSLYDNQIPTWIANRCKKMGKEIDLEACRVLQAYVGNSLRTIQNELDKIFTYLGERPTITPEDVADVVGISRGFTVFDLQNAIGNKNLEEALRITKRMIEMGEAIQLIIVMLTRYFNLIWKVQDLISRESSESDILSATRISPYYLKNYIEAARRFSSTQIEHCFSALLEADVQLKSTSPDPHHLIEMLIYSLVRGPQISESISSIHY
jgi:DNA polymerase-3 subunit delta